MCRQQEVNQRSTHPDREHLRHPQEVRQPIQNRRQPRTRRLSGARRRGAPTVPMLMGTLIRVVGLGRSDVSHDTFSLSIFYACPREGHLARALHVFGFLKKRPNRRYVVDSRDPILRGGEEAPGKDFMQELGALYPDADEELDANLPTPLVG